MTIIRGGKWRRAALRAWWYRLLHRLGYRRNTGHVPINPRYRMTGPGVFTVPVVPNIGVPITVPTVCDIFTPPWMRRAHSEPDDDECQCGHQADEHPNGYCIAHVIEMGIEKYCYCSQFTQEDQP